MDHFGHDYRMILVLKNLQIGVVTTAVHWRTGIKADHATLRQATIFRPILSYTSEQCTHRALTWSVDRPQISGMLGRAFNPCRQTTIWRIDNKRSANVFTDTGTFIPEVVIAARISAGRWSLRIKHQYGLCSIRRYAVFLLTGTILLNFLWSQILPSSKALRSLHWRTGIEIPNPL